MASPALPAYAPGTGEASLADDLCRWVRSEPIAALLDLDGAALPSGTCASQLDWLESFSAEHWDFRKGAERNQAADVSFSEQQVATTIEAATALGLATASTPRRTTYDHVLILGGLVRACILRPAYTAELVADGHLASPDICALGGLRELAGDEPEIVRDADLGSPSTEFDAMDLGLRRAFGLGTPDDIGGRAVPDDLFRSWAAHRYHRAGTSYMTLAAPSTDPEHRRANTADTYAFWAAELTRPAAGAHVLVVTTAIYVPFQHCEAIRCLGRPFGVDVDTVGIDTSVAPGALRQTFGPQNYLQEVRSAIRSMRALHAELGA